MTECTQILAEKWKLMSAKDKAKYKEQQLELSEQYLMELKRYEKDLAIFRRENPDVVIEERKRGRPRKYPLTSPASSSPSSPDSSSSDQSGKRKRGRPRKHPLPVDVQLPVKKRAKIAKSQHGPKSKPTQDDVVLSLMDDNYKDIMYGHFRMLGVNRVKEEEDEAIEKVFALLKRRVGRDGSFFKRVQATGTYVVVPENEARSSELPFHLCLCISVTCAFR